MQQDLERIAGWFGFAAIMLLSLGIALAVRSWVGGWAGVLLAFPIGYAGGYLAAALTYDLRHPERRD